MRRMARDRGLLLVLVLCLLHLCRAAPDSTNPAFYNYESDVSDVDPDLESLDLKLQSHSGSFRILDRRRRGVPVEPEQPSTVKPASLDQPIVRSKSNASVSVPYSTAEQNSTATGGKSAEVVPATTGSTPTTSKPGGNSTAKAVIVSTPIVPSTDKDTKQVAKNVTVTNVTPSVDDNKSKVHVWANQTRWANATDAKAGGQDVNESDLDDFSLDKYPAEVTNKTLKENNITKAENDTHQYYNSTFSVDEEIGKSYWIDLDGHPDMQVNTLLSKSHRRAATIKLKFDFPFYGHKVRNITIATGGFLYTGEYVHSWLAATQYIAPLMANFDTTISPDSYVKYADNGTAFTVAWENVHLQDKPDAGAFTFQVTLLQSGDIIFVYSKIPVLVENIQDKEHPVKIGLSDAYMMDRTVFFARRKTIYEYHRVNFNRGDIKNWTVIYLKALPTCLQMENCNDCLTKIKGFDCKWCPELHKCSTGTFRFRQEWLQKGCDSRNVKEEAKCPARSADYEHPDSRAMSHHNGDMPEITKSNQIVGSASSTMDNSSNNVHGNVSGIIGVILTIALVAALVAWAGYAYRNPHSASGQMLIRYRPSQWSWRRGEARYTAATIHM